MPDQFRKQLGEHEAALHGQGAEVDPHALVEHAHADDLRLAADHRSDLQDAVAKQRHEDVLGELSSLAADASAYNTRQKLLLWALAAAVAVAGILGWTERRATVRADASAVAAQRAADCSGLLLGSIAQQQVDPQARALGCDTRVADVLIARGKARDAALLEAQRKAAAEARQAVQVACRLAVFIPVPPNSSEAAEFRKEFGCS